MNISATERAILDRFLESHSTFTHIEVSGRKYKCVCETGVYKVSRHSPSLKILAPMRAVKDFFARRFSTTTRAESYANYLNFAITGNNSVSSKAKCSVSYNSNQLSREDQQNLAIPARTQIERELHAQVTTSSQKGETSGVNSLHSQSGVNSNQIGYLACGKVLPPNYKWAEGKTSTNDYELPLIESSRNGTVAPYSQALKYRTQKNAEDVCYNGRSVFHKAKFQTSPALSTGMLLQCAGLVIVNKIQGWHYLAHITHATHHQDIFAHLNNEFGDANNFSDCEIFILPGRYAETGSTVREILTAFSKIDPEICKKIAFRHFENTATSSTFAVIEGEVYALSKDSSYGKRHDKNIPMDTEYHDFYTYGGPILQI